MNQSRRRQPKNQQMSGQVAISGVHRFVCFTKGSSTEVWVRKGANEHRLKDIILIARSGGVPVIDVSSQDFDDAVSGDTNHQSVIAFAKPREMEPENALRFFWMVLKAL